MLHLCGARQVRELAEHQRLHSGLKIVRCHICEKDFTEKGTGTVNTSLLGDFHQNICENIFKNKLLQVPTVSAS
jgi:hypothetical protein